MTGVLTLVAATAIGINVGWQPLSNGGFEYIIQIEPQTLESLQRGEDITSLLPPSVQGLRGYRITMGNAPLPHQDEPPPSEPAPSAPPAVVAPASDAAANVPANGVSDADGPAFGPYTAASPPRDVGTSAAGAAGNVTARPELLVVPNARDIGTSDSGYNAPGMKRDVITAGAEENVAKTKDDDATATATQNTVAKTSSISDWRDWLTWLPFAGTILALCASVAANIFLSWNTVALRSRYRALVRRLPAH